MAIGEERGVRSEDDLEHIRTWRWLDPFGVTDPAEIKLDGCKGKLLVHGAALAGAKAGLQLLQKPLGLRCISGNIIPRGFDKDAEVIGRPLQQAHDMRVCGQPAGSNGIEHCLESMREGNQICQRKRARPALDGMDGTENGIHRFDILRPGLHCCKAIGKGGKKILAFLEEGVAD